MGNKTSNDDFKNKNKVLLGQSKQILLEESQGNYYITITQNS